MKTLVFFFAFISVLSLNAQVYSISDVDVAPKFANGKMTSDDFLRYYLTYPQSAYDKGVEGTVTLQYLVDATGMVEDVKVIKGVSTVLDAEAERVASLMPFYSPAQKDGKNVAVKMNFPVVFTKENSKVVPDVTPAAVQNIPASNEPKNPLYVVDGKVLGEDSNIDPSNIKQIRIVKGSKAIKLYGNRAMDGLILIETKQ